MTFLDLALWAQNPPFPRQGNVPQADGSGGAMAAMIAAMACPLIIVLVLVIVLIASQWKIFTKAGEPGWVSLVPIYNTMVMARISGHPEIWGLLTLIPCVGIYFAIVIVIDLCKAFGKDVGYAIGMILLPIVFLPMLAFGSAQYQGAGGARTRKRRDFDDDDDRGGRRRRDDDDDDRGGRDKIRR